MSNRRFRPRGRLAVATVSLAAIVVGFGGIAGSAPGQSMTTINVDTLPIANGLPLTLGINKGFFSAHGLEIKTKTIQSGNDIVLALADGEGDRGRGRQTTAKHARAD